MVTLDSRIDVFIKRGLQIDLAIALTKHEMIKKQNKAEE